MSSEASLGNERAFFGQTAGLDVSILIYQTPNDVTLVRKVAAVAGGAVPPVVYGGQGPGYFLEGLLIRTVRHDGDSGATVKFRRLTHEQCTSRLGLPNTLAVAVLGVVRLLSCYYLLVATERENVGSLPSAGVKYPIYLARRLVLLPVPAVEMLTDEQRKIEQTQLDVLQGFLDDSGFYYSLGPPGEQLTNPGYDLTRSVQQRHSYRQRLGKSAAYEPDGRFFWNRYLLRDFAASGVTDWAVPVVDGFVSICEVSTPDCVVTYVMITRRGCLRAGARYYVRGADPLGNVANFAETEQIVVRDSVLSSFVQIRGSIPLLWTQKAKGYTSPKPQIVPSIFSRSAFQRHFAELYQCYDSVTHVSVVSLIDQTGNEADLADEFGLQIKLLGYPVDRLRFVDWDFHEECRGGHFENVDRLISMLSDDLERHSYFLVDDGNPTVGPALVQTGLVRTNCIDCLDRTNVVQSEVAKFVLYKQLRHLGILIAGEGLDQRFALFNDYWKNSWADNADVMSLRYTGTGALKTDYTRTGRRSTAGALSDAVLSTKRTLNRNLKDDDRQHGTDLFLGEDQVALPPAALVAAAHADEPVAGVHLVRKCSIYGSDVARADSAAAAASAADSSKASAASSSSLAVASTSTASGSSSSVSGDASSKRRRDRSNGERESILLLRPPDVVIYTPSRAKMKVFPLASLKQVVRSFDNYLIVQLHFESRNCPHAKYYAMSSPSARERLLAEVVQQRAPALVPDLLVDLLAPSAQTVTLRDLSIFLCTCNLQHRLLRSALGGGRDNPLQIAAGHDIYAFGMTNVLSSEMSDLQVLLLAQLGRQYEPVIVVRTGSTLLLVAILQTQLVRCGNVHSNFVLPEERQRKKGGGLFDQVRKYRQKSSGVVYLPKLVKPHSSTRIPSVVSGRDELLGAAAYFTLDDETVLCFINIGESHTPVRLEHEWPLMATFHHIFVLGNTPFLPEDALQLAATVRWKSPLSLVVTSCQTGVAATAMAANWLTCSLPLSAQPPPSAAASAAVVNIQLSKLAAELKPSPNRSSGVPDPAVAATARFLRSYASTAPVKKSLKPQWSDGLVCCSYVADYQYLSKQHLILVCYDSGIQDNNILGVGHLSLRVTGPFEVKLYHPSSFLCAGLLRGLLEGMSTPGVHHHHRPAPPVPVSTVAVGNLIDLDPAAPTTLQRMFDDLSKSPAHPASPLVSLFDDYFSFESANQPSSS